MNKTVRDKLVSMREEKYREFSSALIPGCENMLGVRVPVIRKYAKEILKENTDWQKILEEDDVYFEETMLRGFIIGMATLKEDDVELAKENQIQGVGVAHNKDTEYLKSIPDGTQDNNLSHLPTVHG